MVLQMSQTDVCYMQSQNLKNLNSCIQITYRTQRHSEGGADRTRRHLLGVANGRKNCKQNCTHANSDCISSCLPMKNKKIQLSLTRHAQHHITSDNPTTLSVKGLAWIYPGQTTAIMCHVKFDNYKKLSSRIYSTPRCVAENFAMLLKIMRNYTIEQGLLNGVISHDLSKACVNSHI